MSESLRDTLLRQLETAWKLAAYHLDGLTMEDCLWRPAERGPHVRKTDEGALVPDWPPNEDYSAGPPSIAWIGWHILYWWSMALDRNFGTGTLEREDIGLKGDVEGLRRELEKLYDRWHHKLAAVDDDALQSRNRVRWPFEDRPLADLFAWANVELTKNVAEIGLIRFLRGSSAV